jgi:hypothetical protein
VVLAQILANYANVKVITENSDANVVIDGVPTVVNTFGTSGSDGFVEIYNPYPPQEIMDSRSNVALSGIPQTVTMAERDAFNPPRYGSWWWSVSPGATLSCDVNVTAGLE